MLAYLCIPLHVYSFFWMFDYHYVCYLLHVVGSLPPAVCAGQELPAYGQLGLVSAIVSGSNGEQYFTFAPGCMYSIFFSVFRSHYICYAFHVVGVLGPCVSPGKELAPYGQTGVQLPIVSGTAARDAG